MRFKVDLPEKMVTAVAGTSIHIIDPATGQHITQAVYADPVTNTPLANPYSHPGGKVAFYTAQPVSVQVGVQPAGAASAVFSPVVTSASKVFSYSLLKAAGQPVGWALS